MAEEKKKQVRKVSVCIVKDGMVVDELVYKVVVPPESTVDAEIASRLEYLKDEPGLSWHVSLDELIREV